VAKAGQSSSLIDTRVIYCGECLDQLRKLPDACVDLIYIDSPFNSNRNYEVFWGETSAGASGLPRAAISLRLISAGSTPVSRRQRRGLMRRGVPLWFDGSTGGSRTASTIS